LPSADLTTVSQRPDDAVFASAEYLLCVLVFFFFVIDLIIVVRLHSSPSINDQCCRYAWVVKYLGLLFKTFLKPQKSTFRFFLVFSFCYFIM